MKRVFLALLSCLLSLSAIAQLGGSIIYQPITPTVLPPVQLPKITSIRDQSYQQRRQELELEMLREQKRALQNQNNRSQSNSVKRVFKLENINTLDSKLNLTEWEILPSPRYATFDDSFIKLNIGMQTKTYEISNCIDNNDGSFTFETVQKAIIVVIPMEKGIFMIAFIENNLGVTYAGTLDDTN